MRIHLQLKPNNQKVPINHLHLLVGVFHKWIGENDIHNDLSLYSLSWLQGGNLVKESLNYPEGSRWCISVFDDSLMKKLITGIRRVPDVFCGMEVQEIRLESTPSFGHEKIFKVGSPVLVRERIDNSYAHLSYLDVQADSILTNILKSKLKKAGLNHEGVTVAFDRNYSKAKTKLVHYREIGNKANICPVIISGTPEQLAFAWNVGIGNSTGIGFGSLI